MARAPWMTPTREADTEDAGHGPAPEGPLTLSFDVGGTGLKASVLASDGSMLVDRVRVKTPYPCPPPVLVKALVGISAQLPPFDRVSVGFPGMVRSGRVLTAPNLATVNGPGTKTSPELVAQWHGFELADELSRVLGRPTRVANDADLQGLDAVSGTGLEMVITLGTGLGSAVFLDGKLAPHLELAHQPFRKGETYNEQLGDLARRRIGNRLWSKRVAKAVHNFYVLLAYDHLYVGGGNAQKLAVDLGPNVSRVDNKAGILGGLKLWEDDPT